jgi:hypothetical protein
MGRQRHELFTFMREISDEMKAEYERIVRRSSDDPGTAGDEGEENWAGFLRNWLPATYPVVTKGRILGSNGNASPQVDVLVLSPNYPLHLRNKKLYFAGGVIAAFECKLTLRPPNLAKAFQTSQAIKSIESQTPASLYEEFNSRIIYGLLAHSHSWKKGKIRDQVFNIMENITNVHENTTTEAKELIDLICIADTATYVLTKELHYGKVPEDMIETLKELKSKAALTLGYHAHWVDEGDPYSLRGTIHGTMIAFLLRKMGYKDASIRNFAQYLRETAIEGASIGRIAAIPMRIDQRLISRKFKEHGGEENLWNEWGKEF